ncbi:MAG: hypothetical protein LQ340_004151 [Diploschistes diacapsis]|nr:MAG: hypothetical protein LQ340_004151 [Diploschistes diacapsis]
MSAKRSASTVQPAFEHLQEIDIGAEELVTPVASWLSSHKSFWRPTKHAGFEEIPKEHLDNAFIDPLGGKVCAALSSYKKLIGHMLHRSQITQEPCAPQFGIKGTETILIPIDKLDLDRRPSKYTKLGDDTLDYADLIFGRAYLCREDKPGYIGPGVSFIIFVLGNVSKASK